MADILLYDHRGTPVSTIDRVTLDQQFQALGESLFYLEEENRSLWYKLTQLEQRELSRDEQDTAVDQSRKYYYRHPYGRAILRGLQIFVFGAKGVLYKAQDIHPAVQPWLDAFWKENKMGLRQIEWGFRAWRDGNAYLRLFTNEITGKIAVRFVNDKEITDIKTDDNDAEKIISYHRIWSVKKHSGIRETKEEDIPAEEIIHLSFDKDSDIKKGRPLLEPVLKRLEQYDDWLEGRVILNKLKGSIWAHKKVSGTPAQVAAIAAKTPDRTRKSSEDTTTLSKFPHWGTILTTSDSVSFEMMEAKVNANDTAEDGRQIRLAIAAGVLFPEFMLAADASNSSYSSTMIAESPFVGMIRFFRFFLEEAAFKSLLQKVIEAGIAAKKLPATSTEITMRESEKIRLAKIRTLKPLATSQALISLCEQEDMMLANPESMEAKEIPTKTEVDLEWPPITVRDLLKETQAYGEQLAMGVISKETTALRLGNDWDEENRKIQREAMDPEGRVVNNEEENFFDDEEHP